MQLERDISIKMRNMGIVCAFFVVMIHCRPKFDEGTFAWWFKQFTECGVTSIAVPFFFTVSGFFVAGNLGRGYKNEVIKRVKTLVMPFFMWMMLFWVYSNALYNAKSVVMHKSLAVIPIGGLRGMGLWHSGCPFLTPLWYLRALFLLVLVSPLLVRLVERFRVGMLIVFFGVYFILCPYVPMSHWGWMQELTRTGIVPVLGVFYFSVGIAINRGILKDVSWGKSGLAALAVGFILVALRAYLFYEKSPVAEYVGCLGIPFLLYGVFKSVPVRAWPAWMVKNAFPVYLIHKFLYPIVFECSGQIRGWVAYLGVSVLVFFLSLGMANLMKSHMPKASAILFGGR